MGVLLGGEMRWTKEEAGRHWTLPPVLYRQRTSYAKSDLTPQPLPPQATVLGSG